MRAPGNGRWPKVALVVFAVLAWVGLADGAEAQVSSEARIHPSVVLRDLEGGNVLETGGPVSPLNSCGGCHDVEFITQHTLHAGPGLEALASPARAVSSRPWTPDDVEDPEMNCFLCHTPEPANDHRLGAIRREQGAWAATATLVNAGIVEAEGEVWRWNPRAFDEDGQVLDSLLAIQGPRSRNCALCHGVAADDMENPVVITGLGPGDWQTLSRGEIFSPQRISESGVNLMGKTELDRSWDVHAERLLECTNCHFSVNNPTYREEPDQTQPEGLKFDSRRMPIGAYLQRPSHDFAGQSSASGHTLTSRGLECTTCHDPEPTHRWLPFKERHLDALACEVCHSPALYSVAVESVDWTRIDGAGAPAVTWRGCEAGCETGASDLVRGIEPTLLLREGPKGQMVLAPYNLVTSWYWVEGESGDPVELARVQEASGALANGSGPDLAELMEEELRRLGVTDPRIVGEVEPYPIHHGVAGGEWATRDCQTCHDQDSRMGRAMRLGPSAPGGIRPELVANAEATLAGVVSLETDGSVSYRPRPRDAGLYVLGHDSARWAHLMGISLLLLTLAGVGAHGALRWWTGRTRPSDSNGEAGPPVYMYSAYERVWHWLQALAILLLMVTGIEIHVTRTGIMDFALAVRAHNILGFIVIANAAFAALYHLASGEIRQYLPRPQGFFGQAIAQARFYLSGIFRAEAHPFEKRPDRKLNPLQQLTYLVILNVLLPLQVVTGLLMWGAQEWPVVDRVFGGLAVLAPIHTLGAWMFAAFLLMHVYLTTTGPTPTANLQAMILGWEGAEPAEAGSETP